MLSGNIKLNYNPQDCAKKVAGECQDASALPVLDVIDEGDPCK
jgi:hypothetical protein